MILPGSLASFLYPDMPSGRQPQHVVIPDVNHFAGANIIDFWLPSINTLSSMGSRTINIVPYGIGYAGGFSNNGFYKTQVPPFKLSNCAIVSIIFSASAQVTGHSFGYASTISSSPSLMLGTSLGTTAGGYYIRDINNLSSQPSPTAIIFDGKPHILVLSLLSGNVSFYVDGVLIYSASYSPADTIFNTFGIGGICRAGPVMQLGNTANCMGLALINRGLSAIECKKLAMPADFWNMFTVPFPVT